LAPPTYLPFPHNFAPLQKHEPPQELQTKAWPHRRDDSLPRAQGIEQNFLLKLDDEPAVCRSTGLDQVRYRGRLCLGVAELEGPKIRDRRPGAVANQVPALGEIAANGAWTAT